MTNDEARNNGLSHWAFVISLSGEDSFHHVALFHAC